jgi:hypothetical protein
LNVDYKNDSYLQKLLVLNAVNIANGKLSFEDIESFFISLQPCVGAKLHTIRSGKSFKANDVFSPRIWFGKPYNSPQIIIWDDTKIKSVWDFEIYEDGVISSSIIGERGYYDIMSIVAYNDGLSLLDFENWFGLRKQKPMKKFTGQVICWTDLKY